MPVNKWAFSEHCPSSSRMLCREKRLCCSALPHFFELCSKALNLSFCLWSCFRNLSFCFINSGTKGYHYSLSFSRSILCILNCLDFLKEKKIFPVSCKQLKHWMATVWTGQARKLGPTYGRLQTFCPIFKVGNFSTIAGMEMVLGLTQRNKSPRSLTCAVTVSSWFQENLILQTWQEVELRGDPWGVAVTREEALLASPAVRPSS